MRVVFNCTVFPFHREYCDNIAAEVTSRGSEAIFAEGGMNECHYDADFCVQPDESCGRIGAKMGVWINHALPVVPQNQFYFEDEFKSNLKKNSDFIFTFSEEWSAWHGEMYGLPTYSVGFPKLDGCFDNIEGGSILYAPTHHLKPGVYSKGYVNLDRLEKYGDVIFRGHPAFTPDQVTSMDAFKRASVVISDYSSIGLEAIVLNIPTILIGNDMWRDVQSDHISHRADEAAIRVYNQDELEGALEIYLENPRHLEEVRLRYSKLL